VPLLYAVMSRIKEIRELLGVTQAELATALDCSQGNVGFYERNGQAFPPKRATRLIEYAAEKGRRITFDQIYGSKPLPQKARA
jgi:transcriptional regulator with XRE-family HTH domain